MTILETAAKAMYARNAAAASGRPPWDKATEQVKAHMVDLVRAAVVAIRSLNDDVAIKAATRLVTFDHHGNDVDMPADEVKEVFSEAITAILEEEM